MAAATALQTATFRDSKGQVATVRFYVHSIAGTPANLTTVAQAVVTAIANMSVAAFQAAHGPQNSNQLPVTYGASGTDYQDVQMKAVMAFSSATGAIHRYMVPAPTAAQFKSDKQTLDPANANVAALITAMTTSVAAGDAFVSDRDGNQITLYLGGLFKARRVSKVRSINVRDSSLTAGLPAL